METLNRESILAGRQCPYCGEPTKILSGFAVYKTNAWGNVWICKPCGAYVGTHYGDKIAYGSVADAVTRQWRSKVHKYFDPIWMKKMNADKVSKAKARNAAYSWLAEQMKIPFDECHVAMFQTAECKQALEILKNVNKNPLV